MQRRVDRQLVAAGRARSSTLRYVAAIALLLVAAGYSTASLRITWASGADPNNLHRGRWWNYYARGSSYLARGLYQQAYDDFAKAASKRNKDAYGARTYGMHFVDYFPHRESGMALYQSGRSEADKNERVRLYEQARTELETSLRQTDSSRAKFYLNEVNRALWQAAGQKDETAPVIQVQKPIYTNQPTVHFPVTVEDHESYVADVWLERLRGTRDTGTSRLFEAEQMKHRLEANVEVTLDPRGKMAVVRVGASNLAEKRARSNMLIIFDTEAPQATVTVIEGHPGSIRLQAADDFALNYIEVGGDRRHRLDCHGACRYDDTIGGVPTTDGVLFVKVVDEAGNETVSGIPLAGRTRPALSTGVSRPRSLWSFPVENGAGVSTWDWSLPPVHPAVLSAPVGRPSRILSHRAPLRTAALALSGGLSGEGASGRDQPAFYFPSHVRRKPGEAKATSQDYFYVHGTLRNVAPGTEIVVKRKDKDEEAKLSQMIVARTSDSLVFSHKVDLTDVPVGQQVEIEVKADACQPVTLLVVKKEACELDPDAVYQILLVLPHKEPALYARPVPEEFKRSAYEAVWRSLEHLCLQESNRQEPPKRFGMHHAGEVYVTPWMEAYDKDVNDVVRKVRDWNSSREAGASSDAGVIDLVVYGDLEVREVDGEERFEVTLRAIDVSERKHLEFPGKNEEIASPVIANIYGRTKDLHWCSDLLAFKVGQSFPRLRAKVSVGRTGWLSRLLGRKPEVRIDCGRNDGLFQHMKLWLYDAPEDEFNTCLTKICAGNISSLDADSSRVRVLKGDGLANSGIMAITK